MNYIAVSENIQDAFDTFRRLYEEELGLDETIYECEVDVKISKDVLSFTYMDFTAIFTLNSVEIPKFKKIISK